MPWWYRNGQAMTALTQTARAYFMDPVRNTISILSDIIRYLYAYFSLVVRLSNNVYLRKRDDLTCLLRHLDSASEAMRGAKRRLFGGLRLPRASLPPRQWSRKDPKEGLQKGAACPIATARFSTVPKLFLSRLFLLHAVLKPLLPIQPHDPTTINDICCQKMDLASQINRKTDNSLKTLKRPNGSGYCGE